MRLSLESAVEGGEPARIRDTVVVEEYEVLAACPAGALVPRGGRPRRGLPEDADRELARRGGLARSQQAVVDDDGLEPCLLTI
jgi:hypothetical protein